MVFWCSRLAAAAVLLLSMAGFAVADPLSQNIPEPSTYLLIGGGLTAIAFLGRKRRR